MYTKELRLPSVRENVQLFAEDAAREHWGQLTFLRMLLEVDAAAKCERSGASHIRMAGFPQMEYLDELERDELGQVGFDKESAEMLFNNLSQRTGKKATIITTNLNLVKMGGAPQGQGPQLRPRRKAVPQVLSDQHDRDVIPYQRNETFLEQNGKLFQKTIRKDDIRKTRAKCKQADI